MTTSVNLSPNDTCQFFEHLQEHTTRITGSEIPFVQISESTADDTIEVSLDPSQLPVKDFLIEYAAIMVAENLSSELKGFLDPTVEVGPSIEARACSTDPKKLELVVPYSISSVIDEDEE